MNLILAIQTKRQLSFLTYSRTSTYIPSSEEASQASPRGHAVHVTYAGLHVTL